MGSFSLFFVFSPAGYALYLYASNSLWRNRYLLWQIPVSRKLHEGCDEHIANDTGGDYANKARQDKAMVDDEFTDFGGAGTVESNTG